MMKTLPIVVLSLGLLGAAAASASEANLLGFYAGAGVGVSTVRSDYGFDPDYPDDSHPHHTAFKAVVGIRPLPFIGAEAEYIDFGHPSSADSDYDRFSRGDYADDSHPKAGVLSAVGYVPLPFIDVFAKVGVARLETNINSYVEEPCSTLTSGCAVEFTRRNAWQTKVAYGAGVQTHFFNALALRAEYQRIDSSFGDPDAFMVSATWTF